MLFSKVIINTLRLQSYNAVQMRAEMVLHHRYLSASCNDSGVYTWFSSLKELFSNKETWFRARDLKKGGSSTLQWFDNQSRNTLMRLEAEVWQSSPATFLDYDCTSLSLGIDALSREKAASLYCHFSVLCVVSLSLA